MRLAAIHSLTDSASPGRKSAAGRPRSGLFGAIRAWLTRRAVLAELHGLDERTLADLCLYPGDFQAIADGTYIREGGAHDVACDPAAEPANSARPARPYY